MNNNERGWSGKQSRKDDVEKAHFLDALDNDTVPIMSAVLHQFNQLKLSLIHI